MAKMNLPVFKVQRPVTTNDPNRLWLIYNEDRSYTYSQPEKDVPEYLKNCMSNKYKIFMYAEIQSQEHDGGSTDTIKWVSPVDTNNWPNW